MDKEGYSSHSDITPENTPVGRSQNNTGHKKARAKSDTGPKKKKLNSKKPLDPGITQIAIAIIGLIGTVTVAWFTFKAAQPPPTPPPVFTATMMPSPIPSSTELPATLTVIPSATFTAMLLPSNTDTSTPVPSETVTPIPQPKLIVLLQANKTSGKAPLNIKLDARESYLTDYDGQRYVCKYGPCRYTWKVYSNGQQIGKSVTDSGGTFDFKFGKKGLYTVTVWTCRGQDERDCGGNGIQIVVT